MISPLSMMNTAEPEQNVAPTPLHDRRVAWGLTAMIALGVLLRVVIAFTTHGFYHPDEHQQYLEKAQGIVFGPHMSFWEHERGARHMLWPGVLAGLLWLQEAVGLTDPLHQAAVIRALLGSSVVVTSTLLAWDWLRAGRVRAALCLTGLAAFSPEFAFVSVRTLSETAAIVPLMLGIYFMSRRPWLSGALLGVAFAVRFQTLFLTAGFLGVVLYDWLRTRSAAARRAFTQLAAGLFVALLVAGFIDRLTWGAWFHSPIEYFRANVLEGLASRVGVSPGYSYALWFGATLVKISPVAIAALCVGMLREPRLACAAAVFLLGHLAVGQKEARFLWPLLPIALVLIAVGFERVCASFRPALVSSALVGTFLLGSAVNVAQLPWNPSPSAESSVALARVGRRADLRGVAVFGVPRWASGNYFYLRRDVPFLDTWTGGLGKREARKMQRQAAWIDGTVNYLIIKEEHAKLFDPSRLEKLDQVGSLTIYRRRDVDADGRSAQAH
ncbi:hypothetical protein ACMHYB_30525 [Sorangium sp. So ce1128]